MAPSKQSEGRTPFKDLTNKADPNGATKSNFGVPSTSNAQDPWERRRQRDRDRYAQMSIHQKEELLKRRRENYQRKKATSVCVTIKHQLQGDFTVRDTYAQERTVDCAHTPNIPGGVTKSNFGIPSTSNAHQSIIDPWERRRQRDRDRYAQMSIHQKEELLKKRCENYQQKKATSVNVTIKHQLQGDFTGKSRDTYAQERIVDCAHTANNPGKDCTPNTSHQATTLVEQRQGLMNEQLESRRAKDRARYANMTPKQRQAIRDRQNTRNMKPEQKQARRDQYEAHRALRSNILCKESIAMVNPFYNSMEYSP